MLQNASLGIFLLFFRETLLNDSLQENKAQNYRYNKFWVNLMLFGFQLEMAFRPKILLSNLKWLYGQKLLFETIHLLTREFYHNNSSFK